MNKSKKIYFILFVFLLIAINIIAQISNYRQNEVLYSVSVVGATNNPGVFLVPPSTRVSEVIKLSESRFFEKEIELKKAEKTPGEDIDFFKENYKKYLIDLENEDFLLSEKRSLRNIILKRSNEEIKVDLLRFYVLGEEENNPYVLDGDVIYVPSRKSEVSIYGAVNRHGNYEFTENDRVLDIIELALGLKTDAFLEKAEIVRFTNEKETEIFSFNLKSVLSDAECEDNIILQNDDRIYIKAIPEYHEKQYVNVAGEIKYPGIYAIEDGLTTLLQILVQCGEPTQRADLFNSFVQRKAQSEEFDPEFERLKEVSQNNMSGLEYAYFKNRSREIKGKCSVDFSNLWNSKESQYDIALKDGDFIFIPEISAIVMVSGQVENPGLIAFEPGKDYKYYVEQAGGFIWNARKCKIRLIRANSGKWIKPKKNTVIEEGDMLFIPEKAEFDYWEFTLESLRVLSQIATLIVVVQNLSAK
ncbi:MAG: SLBB domain-containing protein [Candidatus Cloacimonetes bacterium]|nr:SLBB domain-containing protein [Candidatus Cloacimonadota bacterium]